MTICILQFILNFSNYQQVHYYHKDVDDHKVALSRQVFIF
jgi:hypothetical protein